MKTKFDKIFSETNCPSREVLLQYLHNELPHTEKHRIERHLIDCEMCSDELEGLKLLEKQKNVSEVIVNINRTIDRQTSPVRTRPLYAYRSIAAAILVLIGISSLFFFYNQSQKSTDLLANQKPSQTEPAFKSVDETTQKTQDTTKKLLAQNTFKVLEKQKKGLPPVKEKSISDADNMDMVDIQLNEEKLGSALPDSISLAYTETTAATGISSYDDSISLSTKTGEVDDEDEKTTQILGGKTIVAQEEEETNAELLAENKDKKITKEESQWQQMNSVRSAAKRSNKSQNRPVEGKYAEDNFQENLYNQAIDNYTTGNYTEAGNQLKQLIGDTTFLKYQTAQWYYALTLIKLNKMSEAKKLLNEIADMPKHPYKKKAANKLKELEDK